MHKITMQS